MIELPENFDSVFRYIVVVSQRAEQLINGAKPRVDSRHNKPTLAAMEDVDAGTVPWRVLSQAEIDAQRQAIVEQFRAEVAGEGFEPEHARVIPDVLPTLVSADEDEEPAAPEPEDRDTELVRLQRLLGMVGGRGAAGGGPEEFEEERDEEERDEDDDELDVEEGGEDLILDVEDDDSGFGDED
ncbi:MAG TPA: DNA-directed RNA polymerase subunit omega [Thermoanaerobaculales bacterium]|nr:DNA-directed RNA polymerase subunit omega [Thermoanaerobaculales bacterium]HQL31514.1 DNA-directed RNA polymerase subunit omega [Thermoanaerobaculales bacterium]HQN96927.1 DNA-directed RNA polymerase subunit omega [Thermoanaerobaculales bacterium]HQP45015.1 DNA-directed RNA polymerase subunit omega [Thermoanaerobaculales bacterium]